MDPELLVIGAGPYAYCTAALAAERGIETVILASCRQAGGEDVQVRDLAVFDQAAEAAVMRSRASAPGRGIGGGTNIVGVRRGRGGVLLRDEVTLGPHGLTSQTAFVEFGWLAAEALTSPVH